MRDRESAHQACGFSTHRTGYDYMVARRQCGCAAHLPRGVKLASRAEAAGLRIPGSPSVMAIYRLTAPGAEFRQKPVFRFVAATMADRLRFARRGLTDGLYAKVAIVRRQAPIVVSGPMPDYCNAAQPSQHSGRLCDPLSLFTRKAEGPIAVIDGPEESGTRDIPAEDSVTDLSSKPDKVPGMPLPDRPRH
jgi:hypothetical protein